MTHRYQNDNLNSIVKLHLDAGKAQILDDTIGGLLLADLKSKARKSHNIIPKLHCVIIKYPLHIYCLCLLCFVV